MSELLTVHHFTSPGEAFYVNTYWIETLEGNIVIDTQFLISQAQAVRAALEMTGKPILGVIITHPHPDHYNGTATLLTGYDQVPVYATPATAEGIRVTEGPKRAEWTPTYGADYPPSVQLPTILVASGKSVTLGGVTLRFEDIGVAETRDHTLLFADAQQMLFCGDLVYEHVHPWLSEGHSSQWLERLGHVLATYPTIKQVYPGHGNPTTLLGLNQQIAYINQMQTLVRYALEQEGEVTAGRLALIKAEIEQRYPEQPLAMLIEASIAGIVRELTLGAVVAKTPKRARSTASRTPTKPR